VTKLKIGLAFEPVCQCRNNGQSLRAETHTAAAVTAPELPVTQQSLQEPNRHGDDHSESRVRKAAAFSDYENAAAFPKW
jgi:hypothetical protein